ncbi:MAG: hypothetical protein FJW20_06780 [Acidimicrobiia bacterium]|nr:hypothetical protein [Acidimicrobiia bacterium]
MNGPGRLSLILCGCLLLSGQTITTYVGDAGPDSALIAWGTTSGSGNTIGRDSRSHGKAVVTIGGKQHSTSKNWIRVNGLAPDRDYAYQLTIDGNAAGEGELRTWPMKAERLSFFVIGDYGSGKKEQFEVAEAMRRQLQRQYRTDNPARFVLTTGDNIYGRGFSLFLWGTGNKDSDWESRFFTPYREILRRIPFFPSLGNHDGNESERSEDLAVYLDNFFFPGGKPARYYKFSYGGLADFFALDSTVNRMDGYPEPGYGPGSPQTAWLEEALKASRARWKIVYFHHPPFTAGPQHEPSLEKLRHWVELFRRYGVQVVFNGHEHNLQIAEKTAVTGPVQYVLTGSGGKLREGDISKTVKSSGIAAWTAQRHFLAVEIRGDRMEIKALGPEPVRLVSAEGKPVEPILELRGK